MLRTTGARYGALSAAQLRSEPEWGSQQAVKLSLADRVALAGLFFEARPIQDRHVSATIFDEFPMLQPGGNFGHAGAPNTEHHPQKFLREQELIRVRAIVRHQEPAAATLLDGMEMSARRRLCHLVKEGMRVVQHDRPGSAVELQFLAQNIRAQPQT